MSKLDALLITNAKGDALVTRYYRSFAYQSLTSTKLPDLFRINVISSKEVRSPVNVIGNQTFFSLKHENIYLVAVAISPLTNACMIFEFLQRLIRLGESYFGIFTEETVKMNFIMLYDLVDEVCDFGFPQFTDANTLKLLINAPDANRIERKAAVNDINKVRNNEVAAAMATQATGGVSWRRQDLVYKRNEAFVDVIVSIIN